MNDDIIQVDDTPVHVEICQAGLHQLVEGHGGVHQSEGHPHT